MDDSSSRPSPTKGDQLTPSTCYYICRMTTLRDPGVDDTAIVSTIAIFLSDLCHSFQQDMLHPEALHAPRPNESNQIMLIHAQILLASFAKNTQDCYFLYRCEFHGPFSVKINGYSVNAKHEQYKVASIIAGAKKMEYLMFPNGDRVLIPGMHGCAANGIIHEESCC
jgi:hypothetical protein